MQPLPLNFVFQGGGAKLGCLIAAADAIYEQSGRLGYKIDSVSGTSAGAIVACMLATGEDPKVFKSIIQQHGPLYIKQITRKLFYARIVWRAWWGWPLYNTRKYTDFLGELFTNPLLKKKYKLVSDLDDKIDLYVHAVDIRDRKPVVYEAKGKQKIVDILLDSSGIPFVFKTFSSSSIVDGGLVDNFPVNSISERIDKKLTLAAPIVGISFQPDGVTWTFRNAFQYARALLSTVMDNPVNLAIRKLEKDDVHLIDTTTSTFDFDAALQEDLGDKRYSDYKKKTVDFLEKLMARKWLKQATLPSNTIVQRILKLHETLMDAHALRVKRMTLKTKSNCLKIPYPKTEDVADEIETTIEIEVIKGPVFTFGMGFLGDQRFVDIGDVKVNAFDKDDNLVSTTVLPFTPELLDIAVTRNNLILFFQRPLETGQVYRIKYQSRADSILYDLVDPGKRWDAIAFDNVNYDFVETLRFIAYVPNGVKIRTLANMSGDLSGRRMNWIDGRALTPAELDKEDTEVDFFPIGWEASNIGKGMAAGFRAVAE